MLITYNRKTKLQETLDALLQSPVAQYNITVLDNASTDGSTELLQNYAKQYKNITHIRNKINIGADANICRAFEMGALSGKDYVWVLCDDDKYDFSNWSKVEQEIKKGTDIICVADYVYPDHDSKTDPAYQIYQLTFVPAGIYKTSLIKDDVLTNMYKAVSTCFSQSCITLNAINHDKKIVVLDKPIVYSGMFFEDHTDDLFINRGRSEKEMLERCRNTTWILGFSQIASSLKDEKLQKHCFDVACVPLRDFFSPKDGYHIHSAEHMIDRWNNFYNMICTNYIVPNKFNYFYEIYRCLPKKRQSEFMAQHKSLVKNLLASEGFIEVYHSKNKDSGSKRFIKNIFSIDRTQDKLYRVLCIFGIKIIIKSLKKGADL